MGTGATRLALPGPPRPRFVFVWLFVGTTAASYGVYLLALLSVLVTSGLGFDEALLGAAMAALDLGGFASPFLAGMFADRLGLKPVALASLAAAAAGSFLCGVAPGFVAFAVGQFLLGAGLSVFAVMSYAWINETLGDRKGLYIGAYAMSFASGLGLAGATVAALLPLVPSWRSYFLVAGVAILLPMAVLAAYLPRTMGVPLRPKDLRKALRHRDVRWISGLQFLVGFGWSAYSWIPFFLAVQMGLELRLAVVLFVGSAAVWAASGVLFGRIADGGWARPVIVLGGLATGLAYAGVFAVRDVTLSAAALLVFAFFWPAGSLVPITFLGQRLGPKAQRTEVGLQENLFLSGEAVGATLVGAIAVTQGLATALLLVSTSGTFAAALLFLAAFGIGREPARPVGAAADGGAEE